jgi:hypothetical protein
MIDIVERLRGKFLVASVDDSLDPLLQEAADEIERLRVAAAEVGDDPTIAIREKYLGAAAQERDATIERCAQVAASKYYWRNGDECAAAIRELKQQEEER